MHNWGNTLNKALTSKGITTTFHKLSTLANQTTSKVKNNPGTSVVAPIHEHTLASNDATPPTSYTQLPKILMFNCQRAGQVGQHLILSGVTTGMKKTTETCTLAMH